MNNAYHNSVVHWVWTRLSKLLRRTRDRLNCKRPGQNKRITIAQTQLGRRFSWVSSCFTVSQVRCSCATKATIVRSWPDGRNIVSNHIKSYQIITRIFSLSVSVVLEIGWTLSKKTEVRKRRCLRWIVVALCSDHRSSPAWRAVPTVQV